jgi:hypothetical protein
MNLQCHFRIEWTFSESVDTLRIKLLVLTVFHILSFIRDFPFISPSFYVLFSFFRLLIRGNFPPGILFFLKVHTWDVNTLTAK